jgi:hypothetical protein
LEPEAETTCTFNTKADLSATGMYNITARVISEGDTKQFNDQKKGSVKHSGSISLPYNCTFRNSSDLLYWDIRMIENCNYYFNDGWSADPGSNSLQFYIGQEGATNVNGCLVSVDPFIFPEAGTYHLTFNVYTYGTEKVKVLYGTSDNVEDMTVAGEYSLPPANEWPLYITNFDVPEGGNYYVALQYHSDASEGGAALDFDNITVDRGVFVGIPDLSFSRLLVPGSSCDLTAETVFGARIQNKGTEPVAEFTLTYQVNDNPAVSQTFNEAIGIRESIEVNFTQKSDLSALGNYEIKLSISTPDEENTGNNNDTLAIIHYEPLAGLPLESDFSNRADRLEWTSTVANGWIANNYYGCLFPRDYAPDPLLSRCISLEPGYYRFTYFYSAGLTTPYGVALDDFYLAYGRSGTDPFEWTKVKEYRQKNTGGSLFVEEDAIVLDITEAGEYVVGVFPVNIGDLSIYKASVSLLQEHDVRIKSVESPPSFTRITPKSQVAHEHVFNVHVQNRGTEEESVSLELKLNDVSLATENFSLLFNEEKIIPLRTAYPVPTTDSLYLQFSANIATDLFPEDNSRQIIKVVSDSTFVNDLADSDFWYGFGVEGTTGTFGQIYELKEKDVLTSINIGLVEIYYSVDFGIAVYPVGDDLVLGDPLIRQEQERLGGESIVFDLPDTELAPGKYFFGVQQITPDNIYLVYDMDPQGYFYFDDGSGKLDLIGSSYGLGSIHVRPNFGENTALSLPEVKAANPVLQLYPNPVVDVLSVRAAGQQIKNVSVYNAAGASVYREQGINSSEYKLNTGSLAPGLYFITVQTPAGVKTSKFAVKK